MVRPSWVGGTVLSATRSMGETKVRGEGGDEQVKISGRHERRDLYMEEDANVFAVPVAAPGA